jgi:hypothetical protein
MIGVIASLTLAQGPIHKRVNYSINVRYALQMGDYMLPAGKYVLYQPSQNDLNLFALYQRDLRHSRVARIRTTRIEYQPGEYPEKTQMLLRIDETSPDALPVLRGWTIPGESGWEIISVVAADTKVMTRIK